MTDDIAELVLQLIPQAKSEAWRAFSKAPHALDRDELEAIALQGLVQAASMWGDYCKRNHFDPGAVQYFGAYASRRMRGSILDYLRSVDWVPRNTRQRVKALQAAGPGRSEAELALAAGLTLQQVRDTQAAVASRPVSLDEGERDVPAPSGVESQAVVAAVLRAVLLARDDLLPAAQVVLALRYYAHLPLPDISAALGLSPTEVSRLHDNAIQAVHSAMLDVVA